MPINKPLKRQDIICRKIGDEAVLYNTETRLVNVITPSAEKVWQLCDGNHDLDEIKESLERENMVQEEDSIEQDIENILAEFKKYNLIQEERRA